MRKKLIECPLCRRLNSSDSIVCSKCGSRINLSKLKERIGKATVRMREKFLEEKYK